MESLVSNPSKAHQSEQNAASTGPSEAAALALMRQNGRNDFNPLGLCQAFFSFLAGTLLAGGIKRMSSGKTPPFSTDKHPLLPRPSDPQLEEALSCPSTPQLQERWPVLPNPSLEMSLLENHGKDGVKLVGEESAAAIECVEDGYLKVKTTPLRRPRRLFSVASNINEKSDDFIRTRKEAMRSEEELSAAAAAAAADFLIYI